MNIKQSFRIIFRNKTYSILNIFGLAVGIASAILIFLWVDYMMSYNKSIPNAKNIYMVAQHQRYGDQINTFFVAPGPLSKTLDESFPEIKCNTRVGDYGTRTFIPENGNKPFTESGCYVDTPAFDMIGMTFLKGNPEAAFKPAFPIVISEKMSEKIFGQDDPLGKILRIADQPYEVTGVFKNLSKNISFSFEWLIPFRIVEKEYIENGWADVENWRNNWMTCFVEVQPSADIESINKKLNQLIREKTDGKDDTKLFIYPILKKRLYSEFKDGKPTGSGYVRTVRLFFTIGLVILLIACINFMNLSTARSQKRALEVGVRKTFGARRQELINLFVGESGLITFISLLLAVGLVWLSLPSFNQLVSRPLSFNLMNPVHLGIIIGIGIVCTFLAGSYPALYLSSFSPLTTLKKQKINSGGSAAWIRKGLVVFQFATAFILICATMVVYLQIQYAQDRELGIKKENLVAFGTTDEIKRSSVAVRNELQSTGFVESSGLSSQPLLEIWSNGGGYGWAGKDPNVNPLISQVSATPGLIEAAGLKITSGKDFEIQEAGNNSSIIINQTLADIMKEEGRVGGHIGQSDDPANYSEIKGIVADFVFNDIYREKPEPVMFWLSPESTNFLFVRLKPGVNQVEALAKIKAKLQVFSPNESFDPEFMDDRFDRMFSGQRLEGKLASIFAGLAIFISCLGLFGLSAFSAEQRTKEIGIRKVMGASVWNVLVLLGKSYMTLIMVAFMIGIPFAWYVTNNYLKDYAYRISLGWGVFVGVALLVAFIAMLTVSFQSLRAATANPVKSIKAE